jgi:hypothetical protein
VTGGGSGSGEGSVAVGSGPDRRVDGRPKRIRSDPDTEQIQTQLGSMAAGAGSIEAAYLPPRPDYTWCASPLCYYTKETNPRASCKHIIIIITVLSV